ncbi:uncharacterized protein SAMN05892883_4286 [Jatrophihabitans sp. GAS493]|uniref:YcnI family protein n=1 Tax=Jatrophihabitans sp. GAS493 TaxID=1907575 RepID=UPI000BC05D55|nr:YcnI family protein [Jatrophihabitans sp. GAS493]SOD75082.1 uncharacterized protein SAMN05892883_4286 [Jatrophihabitans sp. GAS493]
MMNRKIRRSTFAGVALAAALIALAAPASAHVTVSAPGAVQGGGDQLITFRVPNESATAGTVGLKVQLPTETPIASVLIQPIPGWSFTLKTSKLATPIKTDDGDITEAVSEIDWKAAAGQGFGKDQFQEFVLIAGQLPDVPQITFKAIQTYSDGSTVNWTDVAAAGSTAELDHPAPVLMLGAASESGSDQHASATPTVSAAPVAAKSDSSSQTGVVILGIVALVFAIVALGIAVIGRNSGSGKSAA